MNISEQQLKEIEIHAGNLMSLEDIAMIVEVDYNMLKTDYDRKGSVFKSYQRGFLIRKSQLNKAAIEQAISGSSPALNQVIKIIEVLNNEGIKRRL